MLTVPSVPEQITATVVVNTSSGCYDPPADLQLAAVNLGTGATFARLPNWSRRMRVIDRFEGAYFFLSNFSPSEIVVEGIRYPTVEHAFAALKTLEVGERTRIAALDTPGNAKRAGRAVALRKGWDHLRLAVMADLLRTKFGDPELAAALLATGDAVLIEGNTWGDGFWGMSDGSGANNLGQLLMSLRAELAASVEGAQSNE